MKFIRITICSLTLAMLLLGVGGQKTPLPVQASQSSTCGLTWTSVPIATSQSSRAISDADAVSPSDIWAVGSSSGKSFTTHWNGTVWSEIPSPDASNEPHHLANVAVLSANDVWAVGRKGEGTIQTLAKHWDGTVWTEVATPNAGMGSSELLAVSGAASDDVWAVGHSGDPTTWHDPINSQPLLLHWDGTAWSQISLPVFPSEKGTLNSVVARNTSEVWVAGIHDDSFGRHVLLLTWNGSAWSYVTQGTSVVYWLTDMVVLASNDIRVVGWFIKELRPSRELITVSFIARWDGTAWDSSASFERVTLQGIDGIASDDVWVAGGVGTAWHWTGADWQFESTPLYGQVHLTKVIPFSTTDVWLFGHTANLIQPVALHGTLPCVEIPEKTKLTAPPNHATTHKRRTRFDWDDTSGAHYYELIVRREEPNKGTVIHIYSAESFYKDRKPRQEGTEFFWKVRAWNNAGSGPWSKEWKFSIE